VIGLRIVDPKDALRTMFHEDEIDLLTDLFVRLFPRNGLKTISDSLEGSFEPVRIIEFMKIAMPFRTDYAKIAIGFGIPLDFPQSAIFHVSEYGAAVSASVAKSGDARGP
jgi:hypothetical protein